MVKGMEDSNIAVEQFRDKQERLDRGEPTEISDHATLGTAVASLADRLNDLIGNGAGADQATVRVVEAGKIPVRVVEDRAEPSDPDEEAA